MKHLSHNARVLVTDGGRATVFRNAGQIGQNLVLNTSEAAEAEED